jgi:hypothetical protein
VVLCGFNENKGIGRRTRRVLKVGRLSVSYDFGKTTVSQRTILKRTTKSYFSIASYNTKYVFFLFILWFCVKFLQEEI